MTERIEWLDLTPPRKNYRKDGGNFDVMFRIGGKKKRPNPMTSIVFLEKGLSAVPSDATWIEISDPASDRIYFRFFNKKPEGRRPLGGCIRWIGKSKSSCSILFTPPAKIYADLLKWNGKKLRILSDIEAGYNYVQLGFLKEGK